MSNAAPAQNRYKADLRELRFLLFEQFDLQSALGQEPFEAWGQDEVTMVLDQAYKFACEVLGPLNAVGDREGCRIENGNVKTPTRSSPPRNTQLWSGKRRSSDRWFSMTRRPRGAGNAAMSRP